MKKVLAAVLAVAMAASMSAVAFATDYNADAEVDYDSATGETNSDSDTIVMGTTEKYDVRVTSVTLRNDYVADITTGALADLMDENLLSSSVVVTSGKDKLDSIPSVKIVGDTAQLKIKFKDTYGTKDVSSKMRVRFTAKKDIYATGDYLYSISWTYNDETWYYCGDENFANIDDSNNGNVTKTKSDRTMVTKDTAKAVETAVKAAGASGVKITESKSPFTNKGDDDQLVMKKGDTITCPEFEVTAEYKEINDYGDTMTITPKEVDDRFIIARGENLYDNSGSSDKVTFYFGPTGDVASLNFKVSSAQKDLNFFYKTDEIEDVTDAYPSVDFEFITFYAQNSGANVLTNSGAMTFNAIGGKNTTVYEWNGKTLTELNSKYDSVDDTVVVDGIKRLTTYVVAEQKLEAKVEETEAPATETNAPVTEPVAPPTATPEPDNNQNPNTGAL